MPIWRTLGHLTWVLRARTLPKTLAVVGLILVLILGLVFIPLELELEANGTVEPTKSTHVFSPVDGVVRIPESSEIKHGTFVKEGQLLFELENRDLEIKLTELEGELNRTREQLASVQGQLSLLTRRDYDPAEATKLQGERLGLLSQQKTLEESLRLRKKQQEELQIRAPIDGVITTWNLNKLLNNRPVMTGQVLFDIANLNQPMYLRLRMPDKRMHHLESCREERGEEGEILVDFILATNPSESFSGKLDTDSIEQRTSTDKDDGEVVRMKVTLDKEVQEQLQSDLRPGAKVIADVRVGKRASGYVLGYEIYEWLCKFFF